MAADGRGGAAGVSDHSRGRRWTLGQTRVAWRVRSDHSDLCVSRSPSDDPGLLVEGGGHWDLHMRPRCVEGPAELRRPELAACVLCVE